MSDVKTCVKCGGKGPFRQRPSGTPRNECRKCESEARRARDRNYRITPPVPTDPEPNGFTVRDVSTKVDANGVTEQQWIGARRDGDRFEEIQASIPDGHRLKGVSTLVDERGNVRAQWIKTDLEKEAERNDILDAIRHIADEWPARISIPAPDHCDEDLLCIYPMGDPHFGMYAWAAETGDDYDLELAEQYHVAAMEALVREAPPAKHALVIDLGDFFHMDNSSNMTPRSGHILDVDTRRPKVFRAGVRSFRKLIDLAQSKHQQTDVWVVPGNHDTDSAAPMQIALEMFYENNPRVYVDPSPAIALYKHFGDNLIGSTHTHTVRDKQTLGEMMAVHRPKEWGDSHHRYWYCGHVHTDSLIETRGGVIVETFRTLAAKDKWAADNFYESGRDMKCDVIHRVDGRIQRNAIGIRQIKRLLDAQNKRVG